jgi:hypothetical protein
MQHLTMDGIARLADEIPTPAEALHLESCERCSEALHEMRELTVQLSALPDLDPPDSEWEHIEAELRAEQMVTRRASRIAGSMAALRVAAALAVFATGAATGGIYVSRSGLTEPAAAVNADLPAADADFQQARDVNEAALRLNAAESEYLRALTAYAELTESGDGLDPINRLAALEGIVLTTGAALQESPADPVINNYHLTALGQRDALLKQMETVPDLTWY